MTKKMQKHSGTTQRSPTLSPTADPSQLPEWSDAIQKDDLSGLVSAALENLCSHCFVSNDAVVLLWLTGRPERLEYQLLDVATFADVRASLSAHFLAADGRNARAAFDECQAHRSSFQCVAVIAVPLLDRFFFRIVDRIAISPGGDA